MSLPTEAWYFDKDDKVIHKEFVNVDWYLTWDNWLEVINSLPVIENAVFIKVYCVKFPVLWINNKLAYLHELYCDRNHNFRDIDGWRYFREIYGRHWYEKAVKTDAYWSGLKKALEQFKEEDMFGIQSMTAPTGQIFKLSKHTWLM